MDFSEILKIVEVVIIPITAFLIKEILDLKKDLAEFKVHVAKTHTTNEHLASIEKKLDALNNLIISLIREKK